MLAVLEPEKLKQIEPIYIDVFNCLTIQRKQNKNKNSSNNPSSW